MRWRTPLPYEEVARWRRAVSSPDFANPPVEEVALSVQFASLAKLDSPGIARYWESVRDRFPAWQDAAALPQVLEQFGAPQVELHRLELQLDPARAPRRALFTNSDGDELVQVQHDRFVRNWRRTASPARYPRYDALRERFRADLDGFLEVLAAIGSPAMSANQCELTYVNLIPTAEVWQQHSQVGNVIGPLGGSYSDSFLHEPELAEASFRYLIPSPNGTKPCGRLHVHVAPHHRLPDGDALLRVVLTARGRPFSDDAAGALAWLDVGHDFLVRAFASLTTVAMHRQWERKDA